MAKKEEVQPVYVRLSREDRGYLDRLVEHEQSLLAAQGLPAGGLPYVVGKVIREACRARGLLPGAPPAPAAPPAAREEPPDPSPPASAALPSPPSPPAAPSPPASPVLPAPAAPLAPEPERPRTLEEYLGVAPGTWKPVDWMADLRADPVAEVHDRWEEEDDDEDIGHDPDYDSDYARERRREARATAPSLSLPTTPALPPAPPVPRRPSDLLRSLSKDMVEEVRFAIDVYTEVIGERVPGWRFPDNPVQIQAVSKIRRLFELRHPGQRMTREEMAERVGRFAGVVYDRFKDDKTAYLYAPTRCMDWIEAGEYMRPAPKEIPGSTPGNPWGNL